MEGRTDGRMDGRTDEWTHGQNHFCHPYHTYAEQTSQKHTCDSLLSSIPDTHATRHVKSTSATHLYRPYQTQTPADTPKRKTVTPVCHPYQTHPHTSRHAQKHNCDSFLPLIPDRRQQTRAKAQVRLPSAIHTRHTHTSRQTRQQHKYHSRMPSNPDTHTSRQTRAKAQVRLPSAIHTRHTH